MKRIYQKKITMKINDIVQKIITLKKFAITFHTSPDGDSLGSALALLIGLRKLKKDVCIISKEIIPQTFSFCHIQMKLMVK